MYKMIKMKKMYKMIKMKNMFKMIIVSEHDLIT